MTTSGGAITAIDYSGRVENRGGTLYRKTGDTGLPADTPPANILILTDTVDSQWLWTGAAYKLISGPERVAESNVIGGTPAVYLIPVPAGTTGDVDITITYKTRILDCYLVKKAAAGGGAGTVQLKNSTNAITDAMSIDVADQAIVRATTINDANWEVAAGGTLRATRTRTASTDETCLVVVTGVYVA